MLYTIRVVIAILLSIVVVFGMIFLFLTWKATPPKVKAGSHLSDYSQVLGSPDHIYIDCNKGTAELRYSYGALLFEELLLLEVSTTGSILSVRQDQAF